MRNRTPAIVLCLLALVSAPAFAATSKGVTYNPEVLPRRGVDYMGGRQFAAAFGAFPWEIKATFKHDDGNLGTFKVGETIKVVFTIGVKGKRNSANTKSFQAPIPKVHIYEGGKVKEVLAMKRGAC